MLISEPYRELNRELHSRNPRYGTSGQHWAPIVARIANLHHVETILDYGCGKGTLKEQLAGKTPALVLEYDPAVPGKDTPPLPADFVVCGDVLEHIEPDCLGDVLDDIDRCANRLCMLVIATRPADKHLIDGRNAHLIVEPLEWWKPKLKARWKALLWDSESIAEQFTFIGKPKER